MHAQLKYTTWEERGEIEVAVPLNENWWNVLVAVSLHPYYQRCSHANIDWSGRQ
jgi:hypothetical protein